MRINSPLSKPTWFDTSSSTLAQTPGQFLHKQHGNRLCVANQAQPVACSQPQLPSSGKPSPSCLERGEGSVLCCQLGGVFTPRRPAAAVTSLRGIVYQLAKYQRSNQELSLNERPCVGEGDWVQKGDHLSDSSSTVLGDLAVGKNVLVGYMPWEGYNFEDAIVISERLVYDSVYTSLHIDRYEVEIQETATGMEQITRDVPQLTAGCRIKPVEEKLMEEIRRRTRKKEGDKRGEKKKEGAIDPKQLKRFHQFEMGYESTLEDKNQNKRLNLYGLPSRLQKRLFNHLDQNGVVKVGTWVLPNDVLVGKVTPCEKRELLPQELFFYDALRWHPPEFQDTSLRVPKNVYGRVVETALLEPTNNSLQVSYDGPGRVYVYIAQQRRIQVGDKLAGRHGNKGIVSIVLPREDMPYLPDGTPLDMVLNPLGVPSRMNVGQVFECLLGLAGGYLNQQFKIPPFDEISGPEASRSLVFSKLYEAMVRTRKGWLFQSDAPGKVRLFDGRTGGCFEQPATIGQAYMLKLIHIVDKKIHARSTGPYSLITQQPVRGRSRRGGQRLGEMEVWALEGFGAAYTLQECLTIKSDDMTGRYRVLPGIVYHRTLFMGTPEAFRVAVRELQSLCLNINLFTAQLFSDKKPLLYLGAARGVALTEVSALP